MRGIVTTLIAAGLGLALGVAIGATFVSSPAPRTTTALEADDSEQERLLRKIDVLERRLEQAQAAPRAERRRVTEPEREDGAAPASGDAPTTESPHSPYAPMGWQRSRLNVAHYTGKTKAELRELALESLAKVRDTGATPEARIEALRAVLGTDPTVLADSMSTLLMDPIVHDSEFGLILLNQIAGQPELGSGAVESVATHLDDTGPLLSQAAFRALMTLDADRAKLRVDADLLSFVDERRARALFWLATASDPVLLPILQRELGRETPPHNASDLMSATARLKSKAWDANQMTGAPDTPIGGDHATAWASKTGDMGTQWVELDYDTWVTPSSIRIHETLNAGAIVRILAKDSAGEWVELWTGDAAAATTPRWFEPPLATAPNTRTIRIELDTNAISGWNEIDAVELLGDGRRQWASGARASSSYAD